MTDRFEDIKEEDKRQDFIGKYQDEAEETTELFEHFDHTVGSLGDDFFGVVKVICYALQIKLTGRLRLFPMKTDFAVGIGKKISGVTICIKVIIQQQRFYHTGETFLILVIFKSISVALVDEFIKCFIRIAAVDQTRF